MTNTRTLNKDECDHEVYAHGEVIGVFDMPKDKANELVVKLSKKTGNRIDWHYVGGRGVMKMLPPKASVNSRTLKSRNQREGWYAGKHREINPDKNWWEVKKRHRRAKYKDFGVGL